MNKFTKTQLGFALAILILVLMITFGFGYFFGRDEQIQINKPLLQAIPDVNCGRKA